ncbi:augmin complex subunit dgt6-like [Sitodiplosis mosellana]|uniref:augmin complex subunit dgt6-like n=1 Tax=Sitodiplosis mosellana TaxID=263140 RepID=UPI0024450492|nr:augmin complex subunit dgt6-like [Sitodiplosis mosellana]
MDRTINSHSGMIHGNKKSNESPKLTESFLCDEIHDNLRTLALIHPFSDEFKDVFEKGMFIKPNAKAFPHVMKYLLMICDPTDFRKKFCWPIYNKAAEATFRNSTLDLLNKLNAKYELGFGEVKNKILIFPGGMEFMRVIYELTRLSMQIVLKRNGINDPEQQRPITVANAKEQFNALENLHNFVTNFKKKVDFLSTQLKAKTAILHQLLLKITANTNIKPEHILQEKFTESWNDVQNDVIERGILPDIARLEKFQKNCQLIEEKVTAVFKQHTITFDRNALASFSSEMQKQYPQNYQQLATIVENGHINPGHLLQAFSLALPTMLHLIESYKPRSVDAMAYESNRLQKISLKTDEVLQRTLQLSTPSEVENPESHGIHVAPQFESIQSMILSTPTILHEAIRRAENAAIKPKRISLLDDAYQLRPATASKPLNSILEESLRGDQKQFLSPTRLFTKEPKAKLDPMAILQSITKKEKKEKPLSSGSFKAKTMNFGLRLGLGNNPHEHSKANDTNLSVPDFSSTLLNQSNDIKDTLFSVNEQINTSLAKSAGKNDYAGANDRKMRSLLAVDTFEHPDRDINCSPSGRIEPLVTAKLNLSDIKPMNLSDVKPIRMLSNEQNSNLGISGIAPIESKLSDASEFAAKCTLKDIDLSNIENNQNAQNRHFFNLNSMIDENAESLLNISDRILNNLNDSDLT